jgi:hypothetical protein
MKAIIVCLANDICGDNNRQESDEAGGNLNTEGLEIVEPETLDDERSEGSENAIRSDAGKDDCGV